MSALQVKVMIDRLSPVPLYHQLAEQLSHAITVGQLQPGDPFENEIAVAERLQVSRPTVRRAIQELVDQGLLVRRRGLGTTVANSKVHRKLSSPSLYDDLLRDRREPRTTVLKHEIGTNERAASALDLPADAPLLSLARVRYAGETPLALMRNWLPPALSDLTREDLETQGLYAALRDRGVKPVVAPAEHRRADAHVARAPSPRDPRLPAGAHDDPDGLRLRRQGRGVRRPRQRASDYTIDLMVDER